MTVALKTPVKLNGTGAVVTDPCYYGGSEHMLYEVKKIQQGGEWKMETQRVSFGAFGIRTAELTVVHSSFSENDEIAYEHTAGVDSGQMSICGNLDVDRFGHAEDAAWDPDNAAGEFSYQGACEITLNRNDRAGVLDGVMAVSETGCGDGSYPVFVWRNKNGIATKITVDFRDHPAVFDWEEEA